MTLIYNKIVLMHKKGWDHRFNVTKSLGNRESNHYFREYFDKPAGRTYVRLVKPKRWTEKPVHAEK